ncbi:hypothetical protein SAMN05660199_00698 [Klenkia soli]|uniref:Small integral membrane protein n=1 Tax=Klenkia soli TaxID=1052260 RepID=A0A1H0EAT0_9ACTN|nr:hypothetical protein [Klenkia soli]SDN79502.1 hypothetical protein SAMN05660199_00698 [Klenkia soli]
MRPSTVGLVVGMVLGIAGAFGGFGAFVLVAVLAALGFVAGKVVEGQLDLSSLMGSGDRSRRDR